MTATTGAARMAMRPSRKTLSLPMFRRLLNFLSETRIFFPDPGFSLGGRSVFRRGSLTSKAQRGRRLEKRPQGRGPSTKPNQKPANAGVCSNRGCWMLRS